MEKLETIMTIIISIFAAIVIGAWILSLGEFAVPVIMVLTIIVIGCMVQPENNAIEVIVEYED